MEAARGDPCLPYTFFGSIQIFNAILSVFQGSIHLTTSVVSHILGFFWDIVAFVLHNAVVIGVVVGQSEGIDGRCGRHKRSGSSKFNRSSY